MAETDLPEDRTPHDLEILDERLCPGFRRLFAVSFVVGPAVGLLEAVLLITFGAHQNGATLYGSVFMLVIGAPFAYVLGLLPSAFGAILLYWRLRKARSQLALYMQASICGFSVLASIAFVGQLVSAIFARDLKELVVSDRLDAVLLSGLFGILPAVATLFFFRGGMFSSVARHAG